MGTARGFVSSSRAARECSAIPTARPLEWAVWSSRHIQRFALEYVPVAEALVDHEPRYLDIALGPLREWLELRLSGEL